MGNISFMGYDLAPIVLFVYNRLENTKKTIEALLNTRRIILVIIWLSVIKTHHYNESYQTKY